MTIYTDHQSLIFSISEKNPNTKLKRWNVVADALPRQIYMLSDMSMHSAESSALRNIKMINKPFNFFRTQIELVQSDTNEKTAITIFPRHERYEIKYNTNEYLIETLKQIMKLKVVTAFHYRGIR